MAGSLRDFAYSVRTLIKRPGITIVALMTLGLGIGANSAIFSFVYGVVLHRLPFKDPERLVVIREVAKPGATPLHLATPDYHALAKQSTSLDDIGAYEVRDFNMTGTDAPELIQGQAISSGLLSMLGLRPSLGRSFQTQEYESGQDQVAILSDDLWRRRFKAVGGIVGRSLTLDGKFYTVVGVMPARTQISEKVDLWVPLSLTAHDYDNRSFMRLSVIAHIRRGAGLDRVQDELSQITLSLGAPFSGMVGPLSVRLDFLKDIIVGDVRKSLYVLWGAVSLVLLIAIVNVVNLMIARAMDRQREMGIRLALGASRAQLIRLFLSESLVLSLVGGFLGLITALWSTDTLLAATPDKIPRLSEVGVNGSVMAFALATSILSGFVMGIGPALQYTRRGGQLALRQHSGDIPRFSSLQRNPIRGILATCEIALSLILLVGAGLMIRSYIRLSSIEPGFDENNLLTATILLRRSEGSGQERAIEFYSRAIDSIRESPGIESVAATTSLPLTKFGGLRTFAIEGASTVDPNPADYSRGGGPPAPPGGIGPVNSAVYSSVTPEYFKTMRIQIRKGREFTEFDNTKAPRVVMISDEMSRHFWPDQDPIGKRIKVGPPNSPWITVIGIAANVRHFTLEAEGRPEMYFPLLQSDDSPASGATIVVRTTGRADRLMNSIRSTIWGIDKDQPIQELITMDDRLRAVTAPRRFNVMIFGAFALLAVFLAAVGVFGVMSHMVSQRTREIGIRMALGARGREVLIMVVTEGAALTLAGLILGFAGALALSRLLTSMLFQVHSTDITTYAVVAAVMAGVSLAACWVPAAKATRVDPIMALRHE